MPKKTIPLKYVRTNQNDADLALRWNACQILAKRIYKGSIETAEIVAIARDSFEDKKEVQIKLKR